MDVPAVVDLFNKGFHPRRFFATYRFDDTSTGKKERFNPEAY
jgi:hypothetical protein